MDEWNVDMCMDGTNHSVQNKEMLPHQGILLLADWALAVVIYAGKDTKFMQNDGWCFSCLRLLLMHSSSGMVKRRKLLRKRLKLTRSWRTREKRSQLWLRIECLKCVYCRKAEDAKKRQLPARPEYR